jgi:hypothetical protein
MTSTGPEQLLQGDSHNHELPLPHAATSDVSQHMRTKDSSSFWLAVEESDGNYKVPSTWRITEL